MLALFFPYIAISYQRHQRQNHSEGSLLKREVERYNNGKTGFIARKSVANQRVEEIEKTVKMVSEALSEQQKIIQGFKGKDYDYESELSNLKTRLMSLEREYDIVLSENYSLRARVRSLLEENKETGNPTFKPKSAYTFVEKKNDKAESSVQESTQRGSKSDETLKKEKLNKLLYDDTRTFQLVDSEDTSEINLSEI